ncbi:prevent-host-death protein [Niveispirillum lacus]|uniref:Antitoxin n=1 Tax=Niveispirillum lacus TaxID=1981099 RepID=A0A255YVJ7_9PROT|nr:type II toxin-antitoxin system Phd/YefM family antitoxin [Niveispirillum lacus]OYQ32675.1 prevent-host-death protein [Niveispirillum lacus]
MVAVTATEFAKNFGRYKEEAQREPVAITSHGRTSGYFMSAPAFEEYQRLKAQAARKAYLIEELPDEIVEAIGKAQMDPAHHHLDSLLDE